MEHDEKKIEELMFLLDSRKIDPRFAQYNIDTFNWITEVAMKQYAEHMVRQELQKIPLGLNHRIKIGENELAMKELKMSMQEIKDHNHFSNGFNEGYKQAIDKVEEFINN